MTTILIFPALTDLAGQCRIYAADGPCPKDPINDCRNNPSRWRHVGIMNSRGELVCFDGTPEQRQDLLDCQPLMAGTTFTYQD